MDETTRIDIKEFRESGYLQELNRRFLHPLGLALEIVIEDDGTEKLGGIWDYRDDPEGICFADTSANNINFKTKADFVEQQFNEKKEVRTKHLGYFIQPVSNKDEH